MRVHELEIEDKYYDRIMIGQKDFEVRLNDMDFQVGDILSLLPIAEDDEVFEYSPIIAKIKYIHSGLGMVEGYVVLGLDWKVQG